MDAKLMGPVCECGDAFCSGCEEAIQEECDRAVEEDDLNVDRHGIMDHVLTCQAPGCHYQTNVVGDMTRHRKDRHPKTTR